MLESREHRRVLQGHRRQAGRHLDGHREALAEVRRTMRHGRRARVHRDALEEARGRMDEARNEHRVALEQNRWLLTLLERLEDTGGR